jgi:hypothetical protein
VCTKYTALSKTGVAGVLESATAKAEKKSARTRTMVEKIISEHFTPS